MTLQEMNQLSRSEQVVLNVYSHHVLFPKSIITAIALENYSNNYCIRLYYENLINGRTSIHSFSFYRPFEAEDAKKCIQMIEDAFGIKADGNLIE